MDASDWALSIIFLWVPPAFFMAIALRSFWLSHRERVDNSLKSEKELEREWWRAENAHWDAQYTGTYPDLVTNGVVCMGTAAIWLILSFVIVSC